MSMILFIFSLWAPVNTDLPTNPNTLTDDKVQTTTCTNDGTGKKIIDGSDCEMTQDADGTWEDRGC